MDSYRIYNLILYLEKIDEKNYITKEHKALLLTCYTKTKDEMKIKKFLSNDANHINYDPVVCINILTNGGFIGKCVCHWFSIWLNELIDYALQLAVTTSQHDSYIRLQVS